MISSQNSYAAQATLPFHVMRLVLVSLHRAISCMRDVGARLTVWRAGAFGPKSRAL